MAEVERFLAPGESIRAHGETSSGNDVAISNGRMLIVGHQQLLESISFDWITHVLVHNLGLSIRLKDSRIVGVKIGMPQGAPLTVVLAELAPRAAFSVQTGERADLSSGFSAKDLERFFPRKEPLMLPIPMDPVDSGPPLSQSIEPIAPVYLHIDLKEYDGLTVHKVIRDNIKKIPLTFDPSAAKLFVSVELERIIEADTSDSILGRTKMRSFSIITVVKVGNRAGDIYAADRTTTQMLGISPEHAFKMPQQRLGLSIEEAILNYADLRLKTGSPYVLTRPFTE